jgi:hypothetical protein
MRLVRFSDTFNLESCRFQGCFPTLHCELIRGQVTE